jgi:hypothetical protein
MRIPTEHDGQNKKADQHPQLQRSHVGKFSHQHTRTHHSDAENNSYCYKSVAPQPIHLKPY